MTMLGRYMLFFAVAAAMLMHIAGAFSLPANTLYYVNVSLQNTQTTATGNYLQVMIPFNALAYTSYEASNLQNIEFSYSNNGTVADTWLEGNGLNETKATSLSSSANIIYWVKLNPSIAASSTAADVLTIDFMSTATNLFNGKTVGVAPQLYCASGCPQTSYAQYDNGANVFPAYQDFAGTLAANTLPTGWTNLSCSAPVFQVDNGLSIEPPGSCRTRYYYLAYGETPNAIIETLASSQNFTHGFVGGGATSGIADHITGWGFGSGLFSSNSSNNIANDTVSAPTSSFTVYGVYLFPNSVAAGAFYPCGNSVGCTAANVGKLVDYLHGNSSTVPNALTFGWEENVGAAPIDIYWFRSRTAPPDNVMPTATFGPVVGPPTLKITPNPATYGQSITLTATCTVSTDTCAIDYPSLGTAIATGTGTATYVWNTTKSGIGKFGSFYGVDTTEATNSTPQKLMVYVPIDLYYANATTSQILQTLGPNGIYFPSCANNLTSGICNGSITYTANAVLNGPVFATSGITINAGITLTENGFAMATAGTFDNLGTIDAGLDPLADSGAETNPPSNGNSILTSYGGSGGGSGSGGGCGDADGGSTLAPGGGAGGNGAAPKAPYLSNLNVSLFASRIGLYLGGAGGGGTCYTSNIPPNGTGSYGVVIEGNDLIAGTISANGGSGGNAPASGGGGQGGGGGGVILLIHGLGGYTAGTYSDSGGAGGVCAGSGCGNGGAGGNGNVLVSANFTNLSITFRQFAKTYYYPVKFNASAPATPPISFTLNQTSLYGNTITLTTSTNSISYIFPSNSLSRYVEHYNIFELQGSNSIGVGMNFSNINMTTIPVNALTYNSPVIQYFPNLATIGSWNAKPTSWSIKSDLPINQHSNTSIGEIFSNANLTFVPQITAVYPFATVTLNATDIGEGTLNQDTFKMIESNTIPSAPYTRVINNVTGYDQQFKSTKLVTNFTISAVYLFNNYQFSNATAFTANNVKLYIGQSNFQNPSITQSSLSIIASDAAPGTHYDAVNSFCPSTIAYGTFRNFNIYSANSNASLYTFSVYSGFQLIPAGTYMTVMSGITNSTAIAVQTVRIASNPFSVPLENGAPYAFHFFNCSASIYTTNFSVWGNPITITLPTSFKAPYYPVPSPNASCGEQPYVGNSMSIVCSGNDPLNYVDAWEITVYNHTSPLSRNILNKSILHGSSFAFTYQPVANSLSTGAQYQVVIIADVGNVIDPQFSVLSWFSPTSFTVLPKVAANAWVAVLMVLSALAIGSRSPAMALTFEMAVIFLLPTMNILPISIGVVYGLIALGALSAFIVAKRYFYQ